MVTLRHEWSSSARRAIAWRVASTRDPGGYKTGHRLMNEYLSCGRRWGARPVLMKATIGFVFLAMVCRLTGQSVPVDPLASADFAEISLRKCNARHHQLLLLLRGGFARSWKARDDSGYEIAMRSFLQFWSFHFPSVKSGISTRAPLRSSDNFEQKMMELHVAAS